MTLLDQWGSALLLSAVSPILTDRRCVGYIVYREEEKLFSVPPPSLKLNSNEKQFILIKGN